MISGLVLLWRSVYVNQRPVMLLHWLHLKVEEIGLFYHYFYLFYYSISIVPFDFLTLQNCFKRNSQFHDDVYLIEPLCICRRKKGSTIDG